VTTQTTDRESQRVVVRWERSGPVVYATVYTDAQAKRGIEACRRRHPTSDVTVVEAIKHIAEHPAK